MKIWLDDERAVPDGYVGAHSVNEVKRLVEHCEANGIPIELIDCDNDLGQYYPDGGDGHKILPWLIERETFYPIKIHTMNVVERQNMELTLERYWPDPDEYERDR